VAESRPSSPPSSIGSLGRLSRLPLSLPRRRRKAGTWYPLQEVEDQGFDGVGHLEHRSCGNPRIHGLRRRRPGEAGCDQGLGHEHTPARVVSASPTAHCRCNSDRSPHRRRWHTPGQTTPGAYAAAPAPCCGGSPPASRTRPGSPDWPHPPPWPDYAPSRDTLAGNQLESCCLAVRRDGTCLDGTDRLHPEPVDVHDDQPPLAALEQALRC
jgi:hypothetical protein